MAATQATQGNTTACNTIKAVVRARHWCFTLNNHTEAEITHLTQELGVYLFQEEIGKEGTPHLQGVCSFDNARVLAGMKKVNERAHWEPCKDLAASIKYCSKAETRTGRLWESGMRPDTLIDPMAGLELRDWQRRLMEIIAGPVHPRKIHVFLDPDGNSGKTSMAKHICINRPKETLYVIGKAADIKYGVTQFVANKSNRLKTVLIDCPRSISDYLSYGGIEEVKNGIFYNTKYESGMVIYNTPHVILFTNVEPKYEELSADRWDVIRVRVDDPI